MLKLVLKEGATDKAKIVAKGKGANLNLPGLPLSFLPLTAQLQGEHGECWVGAFHAADVVNNLDLQFKAKSSMP